MSDRFSYLITGTSRGLGLELVKQALASGAKVFACCRNPQGAGQLQALQADNLQILDADVSNNSQLSKAIARIDSLDVIINNAAILERDEAVATLQKDAVLKSFEVNAVAPMEVIRIALPLLKKSQNPKIINISSGSGIISRVRAYNELYSYKTSKSALNMFTRVLSFELQEDKIPVIAVDPGWMRTDMGGADATGDPVASAEGILKISENLTMADTGKFLKYDGTECEW